MTWLAASTLLAIALVIYHHAGYPLILRVWARQHPSAYPEITRRGYGPSTMDVSLPEIDLVIPAYNEAEHIEAKLINLACQDYPSDKLTVHILFDGCTDNTRALAEEAMRDECCQALQVKLLEYPDNRGKLHRLNHYLPTLQGDLLCLTDTSGLLSVDACLVAAAHWFQTGTGGVCGQYEILTPGSGQDAYWAYQVRVKELEDAMGSVIGAHGACYFIRRELFDVLPEDTVNDDFFIPMQVIKRGYRMRYDPRICALELEQVTDRHEFSRRMRIAYGNLQQALRLWKFILPRYRGVAFNFLSGKFLRAFMPLCLIWAFAGSLILAAYSSVFFLLSISQLLIYLLVLWHHYFPKTPRLRALEIMHYGVTGYLASLIVTIRKILLRGNVGWRAFK